MLEWHRVDNNNIKDNKKKITPRHGDEMSLEREAQRSGEEKRIKREVQSPRIGDKTEVRWIALFE